MNDSDKKGASVRDNRISHAIERFSEAKLLLNFFQKGRLISLSDMSPCTDEEYIGATLGFAQELSRYAMGRASLVCFIAYSSNYFTMTTQHAYLLYMCLRATYNQ